MIIQVAGFIVQSISEFSFHDSDYSCFTFLLPQLLRKRHIGNDIVTIVFQEPGALPFTPQTVRSQFQHVFIIIKVTNPNTDGARYRCVELFIFTSYIEKKKKGEERTK